MLLGGGGWVGPKMNKFEQVSSDHHQMTHLKLNTNTNPSIYHKTDIWCRGLIAVSPYNKNYTIWKHSLQM